jgi:hypothetical protein
MEIVFAWQFVTGANAQAAEYALVHIPNDKGVAVIQRIAVPGSFERTALDPITVTVLGQTAIAQLLTRHTIKGMVGNQQFQYGFSGFYYGWGFCFYHHSRSCLGDAGRNQIAHSFNLHHTNAASPAGT